MPNPIVVKQELIEVIECTGNVFLMPFMLNTKYGQQYPAAYVDEVRGLRGGQRVGFTLFILERELPREKISVMEARLGRKTDQLERDGMYARQILEYQNTVLTPMAEHLVSVLVGQSNVNLAKPTRFAYNLQSSSYGTIDGFSSTQRGVLAWYNEVFTKMKLVGVSYSVEISGGDSGMFCHLPHGLKTNWEKLEGLRQRRCEPMAKGGCQPTADIPKDALMISRQNFPTAYSMASINAGKRLEVLLHSWSEAKESPEKEAKHNEILGLLELDRTLSNFTTLNRIGDSYYIISKEFPF